MSKSAYLTWSTHSLVYDCVHKSHSQMNTKIFGAFQTREKQVSAFMAGCGSKYGMPCTCGTNCKCANCSEHCKTTRSGSFSPVMDVMMDGMSHNQSQPDFISQHYFGGMSSVPEKDHLPEREYPSSRNPSIISFGGNMRHMSITSETTFGRAMSGLSALSIDWENLEGFDVNVDHSAHINNENNLLYPGTDAMNATAFVAGRRRSSLRRSITVPGGSSSEDSQLLQVSFKV